MFIVRPDVTIRSEASRLVVEDSNVSLAFEGESATATSSVLQYLPFCRTVSELADSTNLSPRTVRSILAIFQEDNLILDLSDMSGLTTQDLVKKIHQASAFWNMHANCFGREIRGSGTDRQYQFGAIARQLA